MPMLVKKRVQAIERPGALVRSNLQGDVIGHVKRQPMAASSSRPNRHLASSSVHTRDASILELGIERQLAEQPRGRKPTVTLDRDLGPRVRLTEAVHIRQAVLGQRETSLLRTIRRLERQREHPQCGRFIAEPIIRDDRPINRLRVLRQVRRCPNLAGYSDHPSSLSAFRTTF